MKILVTGGAGYIGSHTVVSLLDQGDEVVIIDNFSNSDEKVLDSIKKITNKDFQFYEGDIRDEALLSKIFTENKIDAVIHFAGLKAVGESCRFPIMYYDNNIYGTLVLTKVMSKYNCKTIVFSSSATVYGDPETLPMVETFEVGNTTNPYGTSKYFQEVILNDLYKSDNEWNCIILRYFNPVGAHPSGLIGENPKGIPNNLTPYIAKVATNELEEIKVFGNDYNTIDGTGVRDYIHVVDLAKGHILALNKVKKPGVHIYNLGTGNGYSVLEVIKAFSKACHKELKYSYYPRRDGDIASSYCDPSKAYKELGFKAELTLDDMCESLWNFMMKQNG